MTESEKAFAVAHLDRMVKEGRYLDCGAHISLPVLHSLKIASDALKERKTDKWIPVTERLPEKDGDYLVTTSSFYGATIYVTTRNFSDGEWTYDRAVTAWMPLPKPYEGSEKSD